MKLDNHGVNWIIEQNNIDELKCPDCRSIDIHFDIPESIFTPAGRKHLVKCLCNICLCGFTLDAVE